MNAYEAALHIAACFDEDAIPYGVGGALALGAWGVPRATTDVDVSAFVLRAELPRVLDSLERAGVLLHRDDAIRNVERIGMFKGRLAGMAIDVFLTEHPQYEAMRQRCRAVADPAGRSLVYISAEDLCLHKILFNRPKDISDLEGLAATRPLDLAYVRSWLVQMIPAGDKRFAVLDDLERRFAH